MSFKGQVEELAAMLEVYTTAPIVHLGHSYGAFLGYALASAYPHLVKKLILVASAVFDGKYTIMIQPTRLARMSDAQKRESALLEERLLRTQGKEKDAVFLQLASLDSLVDGYDPLPFENPFLDVSFEIYGKVWREVRTLRRSGELLAYGKKITCPVVALHGTYDPHPFEGVRKPLTSVLKDFRFKLVERCGHYPWIERQAKETFYKILKEELI
jgi:pimeloyl-ACP methyl ester carboxylesterase